MPTELVLGRRTKFYLIDQVLLQRTINHYQGTWKLFGLIILPLLLLYFQKVRVFEIDR